jgi:DNA polymerase V
MEDNAMDQVTPFLPGQSAGTAVHAGFPNAAVDRPVIPLDFNQLLILRPTSTYCFRIKGDRWEDRGVFNGDIAVVDRSLHPAQTDLILNWEGEEFVLLTYTQAAQQEIWGVVTAIIHQYRGAGYAGTD